MKEVIGVALPVEKSVFDFVENLDGSVLLIDLECEYGAPRGNTRVLAVPPGALDEVLREAAMPEEVVVLNRIHTFAGAREVQGRLNSLWALAYRQKQVYFIAELVYTGNTFFLRDQSLLERSCRIRKLVSHKAPGFLF